MTQFISKLLEKIIYDRTKCEQIMNKIEQIVNKIWINYEWKVNENEFWREFEWVLVIFDENLVKFDENNRQKVAEVSKSYLKLPKNFLAFGWFWGKN